MVKTAQDILDEKGSNVIYIAKETTIKDALTLMCDKRIGAVLIKEGDEYIGIWTERDLMKNSITENFNIETSVIADYMSTGLRTIINTATLYQIQDKFLGMRMRHLLVKEDDKIIGILSSGDVMKAILNQKTKELNDLNAIVSWDYYENWRWKKK